MRLTDGPVSIHDLALAKQRGERFVMVTAYDANMAALLDEVGVPVLLVGDSLGMVVLGHSTTLPVTLDDMIHHTAAVSRGTEHALVVADLPFGCYQNGPAEAFDASTRLLKEARAHAVKLEGGRTMVDTVRHLVDRGIPVMGHLGLTPQSVHQFGGFRVQGRDETSARQIVDDAVALAAAGAFSIVLECIPADLADEVTAAVSVPTIGIGAGAGTDAQVLVWHDLLGLTSGHRPRFVKSYVDLRAQIADAIRSFHAEVADGSFPGPEHHY